MCAKAGVRRLFKPLQRPPQLQYRGKGQPAGKQPAKPMSVWRVHRRSVQGISPTGCTKRRLMARTI
jgi:hypothetical protein